MNGVYRRWMCLKAKEKYRGMFEIQKSGDKTSSGEIGLDIRTHASHENVLENSVVKIDKDPLCNFLFYPSYKYDLCRGNVFTNIQT